jgi:hypothetical protein
MSSSSQPAPEAVGDQRQIALGCAERGGIRLQRSANDIVPRLRGSCAAIIPPLRDAAVALAPRASYTASKKSVARK